MRGGNKKRSRPHSSSRPRERKAERRPAPKQGGIPRAPWLYGHHTVQAALANPQRRITRLVFTGTAPKIPENRTIEPECLSREDLSHLLPPGAVHQGIAVQSDPLPQLSLEELCARLMNSGAARVVLLDQVTDPHNVGAVLRSAAVFGAAAVIIQDRNAPDATGVLAKAASGALESVPLIRVTNVVRALDMLKNHGFWSLGLDADATEALEAIPHAEKRVIVLGAEGSGLRRLTREACDQLARIDGGGALSSLNVSNAAAVALYAVGRTDPAP